MNGTERTAAPMFEVFNAQGRRVFVSPVEGGGYTAYELDGMAKAGYTFRWAGKRWNGGKA